MKRWKGNSERYELFLGDNDMSSAILYCKTVDGIIKYSFMVSSGGAIYENLLNAKNLEGAKEELENWLVCKYKERIASCQIQIDSYNSDIANLTPVV